MKISSGRDLSCVAATGRLARPRQSALDVTKCVSALLVVCIHYGEVRYGDDTISIVSQVCNGLERVAVPMFFLITGYYYPCLVERGQVNRQLTKLVKMALGASCLYALFYGFRAYFRGDISMWWGGIWRMSRMFSWWVFNKDPFGFHLWYF